MSGPGSYEVLVVEDAPTDARLTLDLLHDPVNRRAFRTRDVRTLAAGLEALQSRRFDVVLLDMMLPDMRGLEVVRQVIAAAPELPILVLRGLDDERMALEAVLGGAQDYRIKGQSGPGILRRAVRHAIERKRLERQLDRMAKHDPLTGLGNRALFEDRLAAAIRRVDPDGHLIGAGVHRSGRLQGGQ